MLNGSQSMHAVGDGGVSVCSAGGGGGGGGGEALRIVTLDAALVSPGHPWPVPRVRQPPQMAEGVSFCLFNNLWCVRLTRAAGRRRKLLLPVSGACRRALTHRPPPHRRPPLASLRGTNYVM